MPCSKDNPLCCRCHAAPRPWIGHPYCKECSRAYQRENRHKYTASSDAQPCCKCRDRPRIPSNSYCLECSREYQRQRPRGVAKICSRCHLVSPIPKQNYCRPCKRIVRKEYRANGGYLKQRGKEKVRYETRQAVWRGEIARQPCRDCGAHPAQMHHLDYANPMDIVWLCGPCHRNEHHRLIVQF